MTPVAVSEQERPLAIEQRLFWIEQALKRDPNKEYRRQLVREYLDLTNPDMKEPDL